MKRFKNILVVYSRETFNVSTLRRAGYLAARNDARLTFMEVVEDEPSQMVKLFPKIPGISADRLLLQEREDHLTLIADSVSLRDVDHRVCVMRGRPFLEIIRAVLRDGHDLVLITADGRPGFRQLFFGATSMHLMRKCPCPVWVIKPGRDRFTRILAAVDIDPSDSEKTALCRKILELATSLADTESAHLDILHSWSLRGREAETQRSELPPDQYQALHQAITARVLEQLWSSLDGLKYDKSRLTLLAEKGDPRDTIPEIAKSSDADLVVMGSVSKAGIPGLLIGNTAEEVLPRVSCSVLSVKPDGFVSPVLLDDMPAIRPKTVSRMA